MCGKVEFRNITDLCFGDWDKSFIILKAMWGDFKVGYHETWFLA